MAKKPTKTTPKRTRTKTKSRAGKPRIAPELPCANPDPPEPAQDVSPSGMSAVGRPTKFSPIIVQALTDALSSGMNQEQACVRADISTSTLHDWQKLAEGGDERFRGFLEALTRARADGIRARLTNIVTAASEGFSSVESEEITEQKLNHSDEIVTLTKTKKTTRNSPPDWKAAAWWLERVESKQFGPTQRNELSGPNGGKIPVAITAQIERIYGAGAPADDSDESKDGG